MYVVPTFEAGDHRVVPCSDETVKPFDGAAQAIDALLWCANIWPVHQVTDVVVAYEFHGMLAFT